MKLKKILTFGFLTMFLLTGFFKAFASVGGNTLKSTIVITSCCSNGLLTGFSNDCTLGQGSSCTDHQCAPNETEISQTQSCMNW
jgi:hypothetical protein